MSTNFNGSCPDSYRMKDVNYATVSHFTGMESTSYRDDGSFTTTITSDREQSEHRSDDALLKNSTKLTTVESFRDKFLYSFPLRGLTVAVRLIGTALSIALIACGVFDYPIRPSSFMKYVIKTIQILFGCILLLSMRRDDTFLSSFYNGMIDQAACLRRPSFLGLLYLLGALISVEGGWLSRYVMCPSLGLYGVLSLAVSFGGHYRVRKSLACYGVYFMASNKLDKDEEVFTMTRNGKEFKMVAEIPNFTDPYNISLYCCPKPADLELLELAILNDEMEIKNILSNNQQSGPLWKNL